MSYTAQIRLKKKNAVVYSEAKTFERKQAATAWLKRRESELAADGAVERAKVGDPTLNQVIDRYLQESAGKFGRTKVYALRAVQKSELGDMVCSKITSADIISFAQSMSGQPQTVGNNLSHLASVFSVAKPAWGYPLDYHAMRDALIVARRLGVTGKPVERERRPTLDELNKIMKYFDHSRKANPHHSPMLELTLFALFSTRRQEEITRILWDDLDETHSRVLVRDMKNPGSKIGNNVWCDLPAEALKIIQRAPRTAPQIFPYNSRSVSANFTRAMQFLCIEDLHFHDLRHEGVSRLFEMGLNIPNVAAVSGHRSWSSLKRYTHIRQTGDKYEKWMWTPA